MNKTFKELSQELVDIRMKHRSIELDMSILWSNEIKNIIKNHEKFKSMYLNIDYNDLTLILSYVNGTCIEFTFTPIENEVHYNKEILQSELIEQDLKENDFDVLFRDILAYIEENKSYLKYFKGISYP